MKHTYPLYGSFQSQGYVTELELADKYGNVYVTINGQRLLLDKTSRDKLATFFTEHFEVAHTPTVTLKKNLEYYLG